jgi:hypothetical protein
MTQGDNNFVRLIRVVATQSVVSPDDAVVIVLDTLELGLIGLPVNQTIIDILRDELDEAEGFVRQGYDKA